jgi:hypothetical protein
VYAAGTRRNGARRLLVLIVRREGGRPHLMVDLAPGHAAPRWARVPALPEVMDDLLATVRAHATGLPDDAVRRAEDAVRPAPESKP